MRVPHWGRGEPSERMMGKLKASYLSTPGRVQNSTFRAQRKNKDQSLLTWSLTTLSWLPEEVASHQTLIKQLDSTYLF